MQLKQPDLPTTEEASLQEAQKHMFKRHEVPKHVHENRSIEGVRFTSTPKNPEDIFEVSERPEWGFHSHVAGSEGSEMFWQPSLSILSCFLFF